MDIGALVEQGGDPHGHRFNNTFVDRNSSAILGDVNVYQLSEHGDFKQKQNKRYVLLAALAYNGMNIRRKQLSEHSAEYLEWIWRKRDAGGSGFADWLCDTSPLFWITGKPGSGKSTLIKYLAEHERCDQFLLQQSHQHWLIVWFYFDFRAGTSTPNSIEGLLRSMIFQLVAVSDAANKSVNSELGLKEVGAAIDSMGKTDLQRLFRVATQAISRTYHICAFIDGLDEFSGNYIDIVRMVEFLTANNVKKLIVASRPEHVLQQYYQRRPHLRMQDHNTPTIRAYVANCLRELPVPDAQSYMDQLVADVVSAAEGVILWAQLVTSYLIELLLAGGTKQEVYSRLQEFPTELNEAYERLLQNVNKQWQTESAVLLHLIQTASNDTSLWDLACAMAYLHHNGHVPSWPDESLGYRPFLMRLRARTNSMIDVMTGRFVFPDHDLYDPSTTDPFRTRFLSHNTRVRLFHKSLDSFLRNSKWLSNILTSAKVPTSAMNPWLFLFTHCINQHELSAQQYSRVSQALASRFRNAKVSRTHSDDFGTSPATNDSIVKTIHVLAGEVTSSEYDAFLACAITDLPQYVDLDVLDKATESSTVQEAISSRIMLLHQTRNMIKVFEVPSLRCNCEWFWDRSIPSSELGQLSAPQRRSLFALSHGLRNMILDEDCILPIQHSAAEELYHRVCHNALMALYDDQISRAFSDGFSKSSSVLGIRRDVVSEFLSKQQVLDPMVRPGGAGNQDVSSHQEI